MNSGALGKLGGEQSLIKGQKSVAFYLDFIVKTSYTYKSFIKCVFRIKYS